MKALAKEVTAGLAFIAIGTVVSLAIALPHQAHATPDPGLSYVWRGLSPAPSGLFCYPWGTLPGSHPCWHDDESAGEYWAIDYSYYWPDDCNGEDVWLDYTGDFQLFKMAEYTGYCTGVRAKLYYGSYAEQNYWGDINYLHIDKNELWIDKEVPYQLIYIGDILDTDKPGCSTDSHLHQSADVSSGTPFYSNKLADPSQDDNWEHSIFWGSPSADYDGDAFTNQTELLIGTDLRDRCPDNLSDAAWPPDITNNAWCDVLDVLQYPARGVLLTSCGDANYDRRFDLNTDCAVDVLDILTMVPYLMTSCTP